MRCRHMVFLLAGAAALLATAFTVSANAYPEKPIEYIIPFGPGGESDITARLQQPFFKQKFGKDLVIRYKPGRGGAAGWSELNALEPDGYTIMGVNMPHIVLQPLQQDDAGYTTDEIESVYWFHYTPDALVVKNDSPFETLEAFLDSAKANPGRINTSGSGTGSANHLAQLRFDRLAGIKTNYVPFKGTGASMTALLGEQVEAAWGYTTSPPDIGDQVRILAVAMEDRHPNYPLTPTFKELGFDLVSGAYRGIAVPAGTPAPIKRKLSQMIGSINAEPDFQRRMVIAGFALVDVPFKEADAFVERKGQEFIEAAKEGGILN